MPQGKAIDLRGRQLVVRLKERFDEERFQGPVVSTADPAGRVAKALGLGKHVVNEIVSNYHQTGTLTPPELTCKGKPPYRIQPALETVIRHEIRQRNREGSHVSLRNLSNWLEEHYERIPRATLGKGSGKDGLCLWKVAAEVGFART